MPDLIYNVKFNIDDNLQEGVAGAERYEQQVEELEMQVAELTAQLKNATVQQDRFNKGSKTTGKVVGSTNKQVAIGNQLFFSLSDGIQDSAQFSQGFSTGMRAVGNNIGFTAELMAMYVAQTAAMNGGTATLSSTIRSLGRQMLGVGGLILAINLTITALTVFSQKARQAKNETDAFADELARIASQEMRDLGYETLTVEQELDALNKIIQDNTVSFDKITSVTGALDLSTQSFTSTLTDATSVLQDQAPAVETTVAELMALERAEKEAAAGRKQAVLEVIEQRIAELEATQLIRDAISELGIAPVVAEPFEFEFDLNTDQVEEGLASFIESSNKQMEDDFVKEQEALIERSTRARAEEAMNQIRLDQMVSRSKIALAQLASQATGDILRAAFGDSKGVQIATALIDTYVSAQKAYASQLVPGDPTSLGRAQLAAGLAVAAGLARVAMIRSITPDSTGGGGDSGEGGGGGSQASSFGFEMNEVEGGQRFRSPSFAPQGTQGQMQPKVEVKVLADRKQLYAVVKKGEEEYKQIQV